MDKGYICRSDGTIQHLVSRLRKTARVGGSLHLSREDVRVLVTGEIGSKLAEFELPFFQHELDEDQDRSSFERLRTTVEEILADWLVYHVSSLAAPERYRYSVGHLFKFFESERRLGRLGHRVLVKDLTPELQARFREWRSASGVGGHTVSRDLAALRGALTWAWKHQRISKPPPFISDVPLHARGAPRDRVLSKTEIAAIVDACAGRPDRQHVIRFIVIELGTAGRPQAVLELEHANIDLERNLIDPNPPRGR